eukprot:123309-Chlamydomonas_euryale.AAC.3
MMLQQRGSDAHQAPLALGKRATHAGMLPVLLTADAPPRRRFKSPITTYRSCRQVDAPRRVSIARGRPRGSKDWPSAAALHTALGLGAPPAPAGPAELLKAWIQGFEALASCLYVARLEALDNIQWISWSILGACDTGCPPGLQASRSGSFHPFHIIGAIPASDS